MSVIKTMGSGNHTLYDTEAREQLNSVNSRITNLIDDYELRLDAVDALEDSEDSPQLFDCDSNTYVSSDTYIQYRNVTLDFSQNGTYCSNPFGYCKFNSFQLYDENDTLLTFNSGAGNYVTIDSLWVIEKTSDTHITAYIYQSAEDYKNGIVYRTRDYEYSGTISYAKCTLHTTGTSVKFGVTFNRISSVYIPYGKDIVYNYEAHEDAWKYYEDYGKLREIPSGVFNPWMQRSYAQTDNLFDDRKINWLGTNSSYYLLKTGETIPVTGGNTIMCNKRMYDFVEYASDGTATSVGRVDENDPHTLASTTTYITCKFGKGSSSFQIPADDYDPVYMYYLDDTLHPLDDVDRNPLPMAQLNGYDISNNLYDQCIPEVDSNIIRMMKTFAIREINHQRDAFRIGTFNVYIGNTWTNRPTVKKELETYGIDMCCFQETRALSDGNQYNLGDYLKRGWQFDYCNTNEATEDNKRSIVSAYEILSSEEFYYTDNPNASNSFLKCVIKLPPYKHYEDGDNLTLSLYSYHGYFSTTEQGAPCVQDILDKVAEDTSDFIVVCGDTNDFSASKDLWAMFSNAGLTPVHDGTSLTVADGTSKSLDNIFVSSNITCLYYDVVRSDRWTYTPSSSSSAISVSDHDFLYADLQFDFAAAIAART